MSDRPARQELLRAVQRLNTGTLNQGTSGNMSLRLEAGFLVTPSGVPYDDLEESDLVSVGLDGTVAPKQLRPSSEWRFHRDIYATRTEAAAIVHAHPLYATSLACLRRSIPAFHYMVAAAGGDSIRCAEYATFGTAELSQNALAALEDRRACLLANHGIIAFGETLPKAMALALEVENLAAQYCQVLQLGEPLLLDSEEMARVLAKFADYGPGPS
jgi:L-fuculose-phosphate aldolase